MNIQKKLNILLTRGGTCNSERLLPELIENNTLISNKSLSDHIRFLYLYTDLLAYYDFNNQKINKNAWRKFIEQDNTVIRSLIIHTNTYTVKQQVYKFFLKLRTQGVGFTDNPYLNEILELAKDFIILLDYWYKNLPNDDTIRTTLDAIVGEVLNGHITKLYAMMQVHSKKQASQSFIEFCFFLEKTCKHSALWVLDKSQISEEFSKGVLDNNNNSFDILADFFDVIFNTIGQLKDLAMHDYFDTLTQKDKEPHMALLLTFLKLLQYAEEHLNHIPQRTLDHYYRHILKFNNNPSIPDQAHVHFTLNAKYDFVDIPQGQRLVAKNPVNGNDILFETTRPITINKAKLSKVNVFYVESTYSKALHVHNLDMFTSTFDKEALQALPFQLFPLIDHKKQESGNMKLSVMIGSPLLYLSEGKRIIHIMGKLTLEYFYKLLEYHASCQENKENKDELDQLAQVIHSIIVVHITTQTGWLQIPSKQVTLHINENLHTFNIKIVLTEDIPAIDRLPIDQADAKLNIQTPMISIGIRKSGKFISVLPQLMLEKIDLKVQVQNYRGLILQNQLGIIDNSQSIEPFGPLPKIGNSFYIGSNEIFSKNLTDLKIHIKWGGLPTENGGFKSYYSAYPTPINNEDFKVSIAYLNNQHWNPFYLQNRQSVPLFQVEETDDPNHSKLSENRTIDNINLHALRITKANEPLDIVSYGPKSIAGFIKLQLNGPDQAFGHAIYPTLMSEILVKNMQKKQHNQPIVLNEPYTPQITSIKVDYEAEESIDFSKPIGEEEKYLNSFVHITPFGHTKIFPKTLDIPSTLFPNVDKDKSYIAFGIEDYNGAILSMHIQIGENRLNPDQDIQQPNWFYLSNNIWRPLQKECIITDSTNGCCQSGIIMFDMPKDITNDNTCMQPGLFWIKAEFSGQKEAFPPIIGVYTQAVMVSRVMDKNGVFAAPTLPANAIQQLENALEGIEVVKQPFETFNGRQFENHQAFYRRVSERLKHKNRAISVLDYERMILQQFPELFRVYCINHTTKRTNNMVSPGNITLVVIAKAKKSSLEHLPIIGKPLLTEIKNYIQKVSSPFIQFEVINPIYEDVKVSISVKFKAGYEQGLYINILQNDLCNFLSPWLYNPLENIKLGGSMPTSAIIDFIKNLPYIEGIGNFAILKYIGQNPNLTLNRVTDYDSRLYASYPWSILVSAKRHAIAVIDNIDHIAQLRHGYINDMAIGEDFVIGPLEQQEQTDNIEEPINEHRPISSKEEYYLITKKNFNTNINKNRNTGHGNHN